MKENKENVKVLTKEDILKLSNDKKRADFLNDYESWGPWIELPEIEAFIFKAELPMNNVIFVTQFSKSSSGFSGKTEEYRFSNYGYAKFSESISIVINKLKDLKKSILKEKANESTVKKY